MVEIQSLTKTYGENLAIDNLNFSVAQGEVIGFLGPNGAGKTTTMKIVTGHIGATSGNVRVAGYDVFEKPLEVKKRIGYLPEHPPLYLDMYVRDYLTYVARLKGIDKRRLKSQVNKVIEKTNIGEVEKRLIGNLSKGFRQRVGIAQALVAEPELLVLDEPTIGLDPKQVSEIRDLIGELKGEHTVILSTHILPEVQATCERIIIINKGVIVAEDTLEGLNRRMSGASRYLIRVARPKRHWKDELKRIDGVLSVNEMDEEGHFEIDVEEKDRLPEKIAEKTVKAGVGLIEMRAMYLSLEDIFLKVTESATKALD